MEELNNNKPMLAPAKTFLPDVESYNKPIFSTGEIRIGGKIYCVERYFSESRSLKDAVYTAVKNEANRK